MTDRYDQPTFVAHVKAHGSDCGDPDCEVHNPEMVEDERSRDLAQAYYLAGALFLLDLMDNYNEADEGINLSESESGSCVAELIDQHITG